MNALSASHVFFEILEPFHVQKKYKKEDKKAQSQMLFCRLHPSQSRYEHWTTSLKELTTVHSCVLLNDVWYVIASSKNRVDSFKFDRFSAACLDSMKFTWMKTDWMREGQRLVQCWENKRQHPSVEAVRFNMGIGKMYENEYQKEMAKDNLRGVVADS